MWSKYLALWFCAFFISLYASATSIDLLTATIADLLTLLERGEVTSEQLVSSYLSRIEENNHKGLKLRAVLETAPHSSVLQLARTLDQERAKGKTRGPLHGIPILIKDNIATDTRLGMNTTAGSFALVGSVVPRDATVIDKLRKAGAIIIGKANLSEFSSFRGLNISNGWSSRGGQTQSAYVVGGFDAGGDPCGSSSGSAVGVSAGFAPSALGTETDGSIVCPSNRAALYAIKPTVGLVSRAGVIPVSLRQDTVGPIAKSVFDAALILSVIAGQDPRDNKTSEIPPNTPTDYSQFTRNATFKGFRLGIPRKIFFDINYVEHQEILDAANTAVTRIKSLGAIIQDPADLPSAEEIPDCQLATEAMVCLTDFKIEVQKYLEELKESQVRTLEDLINFNDANAAVAFPPGQCCQQIFIASIQTTGIDDKFYQYAVAENTRIGATEGIDAALQKYNLDALVLPTEGIGATPAGLAGYPMATVPLGQRNKTGQPFGLSFIGTKYSEPTLIRLMAAFEDAFPPRVVPHQLLLPDEAQKFRVQKHTGHGDL